MARPLILASHHAYAGPAFELHLSRATQLSGEHTGLLSLLIWLPMREPNRLGTLSDGAALVSRPGLVTAQTGNLRLQNITCRGVHRLARGWRTAKLPGQLPRTGRSCAP